MPPVSSRTTSRSTRSTSLSGLASGQRRDRADRPEVGEQAELLAQAEQALLRARTAAVPLRAADGGEQDGVGGAAGRERLVGQRRAGGVDRRAAERMLVVVERADGVEHPGGGGEDLGADPVAGKQDDSRHRRGRLPAGLQPAL